MSSATNDESSPAEPNFSIEVLKSGAGGGHGLLTSVAAGSSVLVAGTTKGFVVRHDFVNDEISEVTPTPPSKSVPSISISNVFVDPSGRHILFTTLPSTLSSPGKPKLAAAQPSSPGFTPVSSQFPAQSTTASDLYYLHAASTKPRHVAALTTKGAVQPLAGLPGSALSSFAAGPGGSIGGVTAVAWNPGQPSDTSTHEVLLATDAGQLLEAAFDAAGSWGRERAPRLLFALPAGEQAAFQAVQMEAVGVLPQAQRVVVLAATASRLYLFGGSPSLEGVFSAYLTPSRAPKIIELEAPSPSFRSELLLFARKQRHAERFAWLSALGILHGELSLAPATGAAAAASVGDEAVIRSKALMPFPPTAKPKPLPSSPSQSSSSSSSLHAPFPDAADLQLEQQQGGGYGGVPAGSAELPLSLAASEFHFLLLFRWQLQVLNQVSGSLVQVVPFHASALEMAPGGMLGLAADAPSAAFYAFCGNNLYEISISDEAAGMWRVYLDRRDYAMALAACSTARQRDQVFAAQAEEAFDSGEYERAASFFAKTSGSFAFEEVALKFVAAGQQCGMVGSSMQQPRKEALVRKAFTVKLMDALRTFLLRKLDSLPPQDRAQATMLATWTAELYLDKINRLERQQPSAEPSAALPAAGGTARGPQPPAGPPQEGELPAHAAARGSIRGSEGEGRGSTGAAAEDAAAGGAVERLRAEDSTADLRASGREEGRMGEEGAGAEARGSEGQQAVLEREFREFLSDSREVLDEATTMKLLAGYGREEDQLFFAGLKQRFDFVVEHRIRRGDAAAAIAALQGPSIPPDLLVKVSAPLLLLDPPAAVDLWIRAFSSSAPASSAPSRPHPHPPPHRHPHPSPHGSSHSAAHRPHHDGKGVTTGVRRAHGEEGLLAPRRFIPAIVQGCAARPTGPLCREAIRFVDFAVRSLGSRDAGLHNLLVALLADEDDEDALVAFLSWRPASAEEPPPLSSTAVSTSLSSLQPSSSSPPSPPPPPPVFFDPKFALRICLQRRRMRGCVCVYSLMAMHREAVSLALQIDLELAKEEARKGPSPSARKALWLLVARRVVEEGRAVGEMGHEEARAAVRRAVALLPETEGLLRIEDLLPLLPDFSLIDDVQDAVCESLEAYDREVSALKEQMAEATDAAAAIRRDIRALSMRHTIVSPSDACGVCEQLVLSAVPKKLHGERQLGADITPFYVFPCDHLFHIDCLLTHVVQHSSPAQMERVLDLKRQIISLFDTPKANNKGTKNVSERTKEAQAAETALNKARTELDEVIASECPFCGSMAIESIAEPFISPDEGSLDDWEI